MVAENNIVGIINLNLTIDRSQRVHDFSAGKVFRPEKTFSCAGGKGVNVARVLKILGVESEIMGFLGGWTGGFIKSSVDREKLAFVPIKISGESRISTVILDTARRRQTVINERGPDITARETGDLLRKFAGFIRNKKLLVISGSLPGGVPKNIYARLIRTARKRNIPVLLDTSREELREGLKAGPFAIKPNLDELRELTGEKMNSLERVCSNMKKLGARGINTVIVSLGEKGALMNCGGRIFSAVPPGVRSVNAVGSGDALVAGFVYAWLKAGSKEPGYALRFAVACGTAACLTEAAGNLKKAALVGIYSKIKPVWPVRII